MSAAFALADPSMSAPFFRSAGGLFENVNRLGFFYYIRQGLGGFFDSVSHKLCEHLFTDGLGILETINDHWVHDLAGIQSDKFGTCLLEGVYNCALFHKMT